MRLETGYAAQRCRLAAPARPEQTTDRAFRQAKGEAVDRRARAEPPHDVAELKPHQRLFGSTAPREQPHEHDRDRRQRGALPLAFGGHLEDA